MNLMDVFIKIGVDDSEVAPKINDTKNKMGGFGKIGAAVFGGLQRIGQRFADSALNAIMSNLDGAIRRFDTLNNYSKVMVNLGYGAGEAQDSIDKLANSIDHLPTTLDKVVSQTQSFAPLTDTLDEATNITLAWSNAMAAGGQAVDQQESAINAWTKAMSKGKIEMNDWEIITRTAPGQIDMLSKALLGSTASYGDLKKALDDGEISLKEVNDAMIAMTGTIDEETGEIQESVEINGQTFATWAKQAKDASDGIQIATFNVKAAIQRNLANVMEDIQAKLDTGGIAQKIQSIVPIINNVGEAIRTALKYAETSNAVEFLLEKVGSLVEGLAAKAPSLISAGINLVLDLAKGIAQAIPQLIVDGVNALAAFIEGLSSQEDQVPSKVVEIVMALVTSLIKAAPQLVEAGLRLMSALLLGLINGLASIPGKLAAAAQKIPQAFRNINLKNIGKQMIDGLWSGIKSTFDSVVERVKGLASKLPAAVKKVLGIRSPSRVFRDEIGKNVALGLAMGIDENASEVENAMSNLTDKMSVEESIVGTDVSFNADSPYAQSPYAVESGIGRSDGLSRLIDALANARIEVVTNLDGKEIARTTAPFMNDELNRRQMLANRKLGYV